MQSKEQSQFPPWPAEVGCLPAQTQLLLSPQLPGTTLQLTRTRTTTNQEHSRSASCEPSPSPGTENSRTHACSSLPMSPESPGGLAEGERAREQGGKMYWKGVLREQGREVPWEVGGGELGTLPSSLVLVLRAPTVPAPLMTPGR